MNIMGETWECVMNRQGKIMYYCITDDSGVIIDSLSGREYHVEMSNFRPEDINRLQCGQLVNFTVDISTNVSEIVTVRLI